jgi:hypothetical protein
MCDDLMSALYERCRVIGANVVAHQKQNFHLSSLGPDRYGASSFFETMPSSPSWFEINQCLVFQKGPEHPTVVGGKNVPSRSIASSVVGRTSSP